MDVKEAVNLAKAHVSELFADENIVDLGLEEVEHDDRRHQWRITLGFARAWRRPGALAVWTSGFSDRTYKVVTIDRNGRPLSVKNRETTHAG